MAGTLQNMAMISKLPWWVKLCAKLVLARLPVPYSIWRKLKLFRHGEMNDPARAIRTFETYYRRAREYGEIAPGFTVLELGPGDSVLSGLVARSMGASRAWLVDAGAFADTNVAACHRTLAMLRQAGHADLGLDDATCSMLDNQSTTPGVAAERQAEPTYRIAKPVGRLNKLVAANIFESLLDVPKNSGLVSMAALETPAK